MFKHKDLPWITYGLLTVTIFVPGVPELLDGFSANGLSLAHWEWSRALPYPAIYGLAVALVTLHHMRQMRTFRERNESQGQRLSAQEIEINVLNSKLRDQSYLEERVAEIQRAIREGRPVPPVEVRGAAQIRAGMPAMVAHGTSSPGVKRDSGILARLLRFLRFNRQT